MSNENKTELMAIELNNLFSKLSAKEKFVFETIVSNGISEEKEAKEIAANIPFDENMRFISTIFLHQYNSRESIVRYLNILQ